tara:strand:- start:470 stop:748 length:279 start_codon:yes stop_codon:yes gene_type:complete
MTKVNINKLVSLSDLIDSIVADKSNWAAKHHNIFYVNMCVKQLHEADEPLMSEYVPIISSSRGEIKHLQEHIQKKVEYLRSIALAKVIGDNE